MDSQDILKVISNIKKEVEEDVDEEVGEEEESDEYYESGVESNQGREEATVSNDEWKIRMRSLFSKEDSSDEEVPAKKLRIEPKVITLPTQEALNKMEPELSESGSEESDSDNELTKDDQEPLVSSTQPFLVAQEKSESDQEEDPKTKETEGINLPVETESSETGTEDYSSDELQIDEKEENASPTEAYMDDSIIEDERAG